MTDEPPQKGGWKNRVKLFVALVCVIGIIGAGVYYLPSWVMLIVLIPIALLLLPIGMVYFFVYCFSSHHPQSKMEEANIIRNAIGFNFSNDFKLLTASSHDYEEFLFVFSEESFEPLRCHLESIPDEGELNMEKGRTIRHSYKGVEGRGFFLCESRMEYGCGNKESIEVDYEERTLKHKFVVF